MNVVAVDVVLRIKRWDSQDTSTPSNLQEPHCLFVFFFSSQSESLAASHGHSACDDVASPCLVWSNPHANPSSLQSHNRGKPFRQHPRRPRPASSKNLKDGFANKICVCLPRRPVSLPWSRLSSFPPGHAPPSPHGKSHYPLNGRSGEMRGSMTGAIGQ